MRRILVSAYGCEPGKGSEQGVGWHWIQEMARSEELWVITRANNRPAIEDASSGAPRIRFVYFDLGERWRRLKRKERGLYAYYAAWQWGAYRTAKRLAAEVAFDYCMHLTFGSMWMPTFMYRLPIPFIWGPIGGGESVPPGFVRTLPWRARLAQHARQLLIRSAYLNPVFAGPARAARAIIARTEESRRVFPEPYQEKVRVMLETGISDRDLAQFDAPCETDGDAVQFVYVGRLVASKSVEFAIRAVARVASANPGIGLTIVGDGPLRHSLTRLAQAVGISDRTRFVGAVARHDVIQLLRRSHVFLFPSLKEGGAWALIEAMAVGLPIVCVDGTGMHVMTDDACAIRIAPTTPAELESKMAEAIETLARAPRLRASMGAHARSRVRDHFSWSRKGEFMRRLLDELDTMHDKRLRYGRGGMP